MRREVFMGRAVGRRRVQEEMLRASAATPEDARLCIEDLNRVGVALMSEDGKRIAPPPKGYGGARIDTVKYGEEKKG